MKRLICVLAMTSLVAPPAAASVREAAFSSTTESARIQSGLFVGATYRLGTNPHSGGVRGIASLNMSGMTRTVSGDFRFNRGAELHLDASGKPALLVGGRDIGHFKRQSKLSGGTTAIIIVGGIALAVAAAVVVSNAIDESNCIDEEYGCD
jgi:hypothetical protein